MTKIYKLRRKADGKFSTGGSEPKFGKTGKNWSRRADLENHIEFYFSPWACNLYNHSSEDFEIVEFEIKESDTIDFEVIEDNKCCKFKACSK